MGYFGSSHSPSKITSDRHVRGDHTALLHYQCTKRTSILVSTGILDPTTGHWRNSDSAPRYGKTDEQLDVKNGHSGFHSARPFGKKANISSCCHVIHPATSRKVYAVAN